jgi:hypothetical protein
VTHAHRWVQSWRDGRARDARAVPWLAVQLDSAHAALAAAQAPSHPAAPPRSGRAPDGHEYTNLIHTSRVRSDGSISWTWPCQGDPKGNYTTEAVDDASGASTGRVTFTIGVQAPPTPPPPPAPSTTHAETTGGVTNKTFTNYTSAGGDQGVGIPPYSALQIACKVTGFQVSDGNTWWYRIASSPWNSAYYATADAFYNNGQTSGSLHGTPFVDDNVPNC